MVYVGYKPMHIVIVSLRRFYFVVNVALLHSNGSPFAVQKDYI